MQLKTKYQYTYFIYPYVIEEINYEKYIYNMLKNKKAKLKMFDKEKDLDLVSYFLPEIKEKMFWSLDLDKKTIKNNEKIDLKMKSRLLSHKYCTFFEYSLDEDIPGKIGEDNGIFFDINKVEIVCFNTGICFLIMKTVLNSSADFSDVLNFNYKFRDIQTNTKQIDNIKIQTNKLNNMEQYKDFLKEIVGLNIEANKINLDKDRLITYTYTCLDQNSWNDNTDIKIIEKEFAKYYNVKPAGEQINDNLKNEDSVYKEKNIYYGFSNNVTALLTNDANINNFTNLLFKFENIEIYHFIYHLHQKIVLKKFNYELKQTKKFEKIKNRFINFTKINWIYDVTNDPKGVIIDKYYRKYQQLDETFERLKIKYDLLYKEYEIEKTNKQHKWIIAIIGGIIILNLVKVSINFISNIIE